MWNSKSFLLEDLYCESVVEGDARLQRVDWPPSSCGWEERNKIFAKILSFDTLAATSNNGYVKTHRVAMHLNEPFNNSKPHVGNHCEHSKSKTYQLKARDRRLKRLSDQGEENQTNKFDLSKIYLKTEKHGKSHKPAFLRMVTTLNDEIGKLVSNRQRSEKVRLTFHIK